MESKVKAVPDGYHSVTPYLAVEGAAEAIEFYKKAFGARELYRLPGPDGKVGHAELQVGDSRIMLADGNGERGFRGPKSLGGSPVSLLLYVEDVDAFLNRALAAGARETRPLKDQFYGDRSGSLEDPFGHQWNIATHVEDVPPAEMERRVKETLESVLD